MDKNHLNAQLTLDKWVIHDLNAGLNWFHVDNFNLLSNFALKYLLRLISSF